MIAWQPSRPIRISKPVKVVAWIAAAIGWAILYRVLG